MTRKYAGETIEYRFDAIDINNCGWYVARFGHNGDLIEDSEKVTFAVNVDDYDNPDDLADALRAAYPGAKVRAA